ncbi:MAG: hypothetical protein M3069_28840, partial [Chloroflexota bacterium]|nr:hypothetical protein [Chloroflexota bacterium]
LFAVPEISLADPLPTAVLGGSPDAFEQQSGPHNDHSNVVGGMLHFSRCSNSNVDQLIVTFLGGSAAIILRQSCGIHRLVAELTAEARSFMPDDATPGPRFSTSQGEPAQQSSRHHWRARLTQPGFKTAMETHWCPAPTHC